MSKRKYEQRPAEFIISLEPSAIAARHGKSASLYEFLQSKKAAALFSGNRHVVRVDQELNAWGVESLKPFPDVGLFAGGQKIYPVPYEYQPVAGFSSRRDSFILVASRQGYLYVIYRGVILYKKTEGGWKLWDAERIHNCFREGIRRVDQTIGRRLCNVLGAMLLMVTATLLHRNIGAVILITDKERARRVEGFSNRAVSTVESFLQHAVTAQWVFGIPLSLLINALSMDGVSVLTIDCRLTSFANILDIPDHKRDPSEGARTRVAKFASQFGLVLKTSHDGVGDLFERGTHLLSF